MVIKFKKLNPEAILPKFALEGDAGMDVFSAEEYVLKPGERYVFSTGISSELPEGYFIKFAPKSGLAVKSGIDVLAGVVDNGYRGEWLVVLINLGDDPKEFKKGDKICQAILRKIEQAQIEEVGSLSETERGTGGFGSTGK
ncbi:dUTP diphosphatase [Patescibacteria group bacterium]|nr:dUTP diphosphatase [Patescibacteria group bacterium]